MVSFINVFIALPKDLVKQLCFRIIDGKESGHVLDPIINACMIKFQLIETIVSLIQLYLKYLDVLLFFFYWDGSLIVLLSLLSLSIILIKCIYSHIFPCFSKYIDVKYIKKVTDMTINKQSLPSLVWICPKKISYIFLTGFHSKFKELIRV